MSSALRTFSRPGDHGGRLFSALAALTCALLAPMGPATAAAAVKSVAAGSPWIVQKTTQLRRLTLAPGAVVRAPDGRELTLTVNGVETALQPGTYVGDVVLTPTDAHVVHFDFMDAHLVHRFRQAMYLDENGVVVERSVPAAIRGHRRHGGVITGLKIRSSGDAFNGVVAKGGNHHLMGPVIDLSGAGGDDFAGFGAGVLASGKDTTLVLDGARIRAQGVIRTAVAADHGSRLIVKNSSIETRDGVLPADYEPNVDMGAMLSAPWMLGIAGNNRATNLLGDGTQATFVNSSVKAQNWGALSNDASFNARLTVIGGEVAVTGGSGYGAYSLGGAITRFFGSQIKVPDYGVIVDTGGSTVQLQTSTPDAVAAVNTELGLGLSGADLKALEDRPTTVVAGRSAIMIHESVPLPSPPTKVLIDGAVLEAGESVILNKGVPADIRVDGSRGTRLTSRKGILVQVMHSDDPGPTPRNGKMLTQGVYLDPAEPPVRIADFDTARAHPTDVQVTFSNIQLTGDLFNGYRDGVGSKMGMATPASGRNLVVKLEKAALTGVVSSSAARHPKSAIGSADYQLLGVVSNRPEAAINNGVILELGASSWTVTGTSYLSRLVLDSTSKVTGVGDAPVMMKVNGVQQPMLPGDYQGNVVLTLQ